MRRFLRAERSSPPSAKTAIVWVGLCLHQGSAEKRAVVSLPVSEQLYAFAVVWPEARGLIKIDLIFEMSDIQLLTWGFP